VKNQRNLILWWPFRFLFRFWGHRAHNAVLNTQEYGVLHNELVAEKEDSAKLRKQYEESVAKLTQERNTAAEEASKLRNECFDLVDQKNALQKALDTATADYNCLKEDFSASVTAKWKKGYELLDAEVKQLRAKVDALQRDKFDVSEEFRVFKQSFNASVRDRRLVALRHYPDLRGNDVAGLKPKYYIFKRDTGEEVKGFAFVLRPEKDPVAQVALDAYANYTRNQALSYDLKRVLSAMGYFLPQTAECDDCDRAFNVSDGVCMLCSRSTFKGAADMYHAEPSDFPLDGEENCVENTSPQPTEPEEAAASPEPRENPLDTGEV
jgi:F0F1-type ATP synthase membrane subunit b/b'